MIQATDLRIGNYYLLNSRVIELDEELMYEIFTPYTGASLASLEPIPLSPEVLEACGFPGIKQNDGSFDYFMLPEGSTGISSWIQFRGDGVLSFNYGGFVQGLEVTHLHQIQNLYMDCAGAELTINIERSKV